MASDVAVCNRALQKLGAARITSLYPPDDSVEARACNASYEMLRDLELRKHPWNFAKARISLAASPIAPVFGYDYKYQLPADCVRILPPNDYDLDWKIEGRYILTNQTAPLEVNYIYENIDPNEFDYAFVEVLACRIAIELCGQLTQSNTKLAEMKDAYKDAIKEAKRTNAFENTSEDPPESSWIAARL